MQGKKKRRSLRRKNLHQKRKGLFLESLEPRIVLSGTPIQIDLNSTGSSDPTDFTPIGQSTYFVANDGSSGRELWVTDGTAAGTSMVADIRQGSDSSNPQQLVEANGQLFFVADDGINGQELWTSDGTEAGTVMVRDINPGSGYQYPYGQGPLRSFPSDLVEFDGQLFFNAEDNATGSELWSSDGTAAGTVLVSDIFPGTFTDGNGTFGNSSSVQGLTNVDGTLFFSADDGTNGRELWMSDGTAAGTVLVKDLFTGGGQTPNSGTPEELVSSGGLLFFAAVDADGRELWRSDGTDAGTFKLRDIQSGSGDALPQGSPLIGFGNQILFIADDGVNGEELWRSDGTTAGTVQLGQINGGDLSNYFGLTEFGGEVFFGAVDSTSGNELWKTDGTAAGTVLVKDIAPGSTGAYPFYMTPVDGTLYFSAQRPGEGRELWETDGTEAGTVVVADTVPGAVGVYPRNLGRLGDTLVFSGDDGISRELWVVVPEGEEATKTTRVTIFIDGQEVAIPSDVGVNSDGSMAAAFTENNNGEVMSNQGTDVTLGDFFDTWRTNAGLAGNNPDAVLTETQLLDSVADSFSTVQMFVNGQVSDEFDDYVMQGDDEVILVYSDNPVVSLVTNFGTIVMELFEDATPGTVDNFLNYVNDGDYLNSIFHRSADSGGSDFVIQGGGFTTDSTTFTSIGQFSAIPTDPPILNEPGISNLRGTVAMAKTSDPNSATSQFFVNLSDTNTFLDDTNNSGGFTVFGQVLDMTSSDQIAVLPVSANAAPFGELPVSAEGEVVVVQSIEGQGDITGVKFSDDNRNGVLDNGESGIANTVVFIDANDNGIRDNDETATTTDADGRYLLQVEPGTYTVRAEVSNGLIATVPVSPDSYTVTVELGREVDERDFGEASLPAPSGVDLLAGSDTGTSADDNLTRLNNANSATLQFEVTGVTAGAEVRLFSDGTQIGSATATGSSVTIVTNGTVTLTDGSHDITATQSSQGVESAATVALPLSIDTAPPAGLTNTAPDTAQAESLYTFDAESPDEGTTGVFYSLANAPSGMVVDAATGVVTWTPTAAQAVPQSFDIQVVDSAGNIASQSVDLTVLGVIPALPDSYSIDEDGTLSVDEASGVLANDGDQNSGTLTATTVDLPANGSLTFNSNGSFVYTPNADFFGEDSFTYSATDGVDDSNVAKVTITISGTDDPTVPMADSFDATEDTVLTVDAAQGVLANDVDIDSDTLTVAVGGQPQNGTLSLASDGSFSYTPDADFSGSDFFTYTVNDGTSTTDPVTVSLNVAAVADAPMANADSYAVDEDGSLTVNVAAGVLSNDSDPDSSNLTTTVDSQPTNGTLTLNDDGSFSYSPNADFFGDDSFTYLTSDGGLTSSPATVTITVNGQPDAPMADNDSATATSDGGVVTIDVLNNDSSDPDGAQTLTVANVTQGTNGSVAINNGAVQYTANVGFVGTDTFTYTLQDSDGLTDSATVTVVVSEAANNTVSGFVFVDANGDGVRGTAEAGVPGVQITLSGTDLSGSSLTRTQLTTNSGEYSFTDVPAGTYQVSQRQPAATTDGIDSTATSNANAGDDVITNIVLTGNQDVTENNFGEASVLPPYVNITWFFSSAKSPDAVFREAVAQAEELDGNTELADAIRSDDPDGPGDDNAAPIGNADTYTVVQDQPLVITAGSGVLANDTDADDDTLTAQIVASPTNGTLTLNSDGSFGYVPNTGFSGSDSFRYQASDGVLTSDVVDVTITVTAVNTNDPPVAVDDGFQVDEDEVLSVAVGSGVLANDTDADGDNLTASVVTGATNGSLSLSGDGSFVYTPDADFFGNDSFTYEVSDGAGGTDQATVTITVNAINDEPVAVADSYTTDEDMTLAIDTVFGLLANDTDVEGDTLSATLSDPPDHGSLTLNPDGSFTYVPDADFNGTDAFSYTASDGTDISEIANVSISVTPVEDPPALSLPAEFSDPQNVPSRTVGQTIDFTATVTDPDDNDNDYVFQLDLESSGIPDGQAIPTIESGTGRFLWTPSVTGRFEIRVIAVNGDGEADQETFLIDIVGV